MAHGNLLAQNAQAGETQETRVNKQTATVTDKPLPGPKYLNLRWDEDFSYLDGEPGSYREDWSDPIKNIHLGDDWRLTLGGELRYRLEAETNKAFGATEPAQDTFHLFRYMLHADLKYRKVFRVFVQGIAAFDEDRDLAPRGIDENRWDLQQLFFDVRVLGEDLPLTLRVGRQELQYGNQRYVSPLDWVNVRRRFDAVKLFAKGKKWDLDLWYAKPVDSRQVQRKQRRFDQVGAKDGDDVDTCEFKEPKRALRVKLCRTDMTYRAGVTRLDEAAPCSKEDSLLPATLRKVMLNDRRFFRRKIRCADRHRCVADLLVRDGDDLTLVPEPVYKVPVSRFNAR